MSTGISHKLYIRHTNVRSLLLTSANTQIVVLNAKFVNKAGDRSGDHYDIDQKPNDATKLVRYCIHRQTAAELGPKKLLRPQVNLHGIPKHHLSGKVDTC